MILLEVIQHSDVRSMILFRITEERKKNISDRPMYNTIQISLSDYSKLDKNAFYLT